MLKDVQCYRSKQQQFCTWNHPGCLFISTVPRQAQGPELSLHQAQVQGTWYQWLSTPCTSRGCCAASFKCLPFCNAGKQIFPKDRYQPLHFVTRVFLRFFLDAAFCLLFKLIFSLTVSRMSTKIFIVTLSTQTAF